MNKFKSFFGSVVAVLFILSMLACEKEIECSFDDDQTTIKNYLSANNLVAEKSATGLHYIIQEPGIGNLYPQGNSNVRVKYKGYFTDGTVFDESSNGGITFALRDVIIGWQEGISKLKKQGKAILLIPSSLAYGTRTVGNIEGRECSVIIFDVTLEDFQ